MILEFPHCTRYPATGTGYVQERHKTQNRQTGKTCSRRRGGDTLCKNKQRDQSHRKCTEGEAKCQILHIHSEYYFLYSVPKPYTADLTVCLSLLFLLSHQFKLNMSNREVTIIYQNIKSVHRQLLTILFGVDIHVLACLTLYLTHRNVLTL